MAEIWSAARAKSTPITLHYKVMEVKIRNLFVTIPCMQGYLEDVMREYRNQKQLAERAIAQLGNDSDLFVSLGEGENSIELIVKHLAGNLRSRWTDFLTTDGEKPTRQRDGEFEHETGETRVSLLTRWAIGWRTLFDALEKLTPDDLSRTVSIRNEPHTVLQAINRNLAHTAHHVGQIVFLAKHLAGHDWRTLSIPKKSA